MVSGDTEIPKVPEQFPPECCPLLANWFMPMVPTPDRDTLESAPKAVGSGFLLHYPVPIAGLGPIVGEAQEVEGVGPGSRIAVSVGRRRNPPVRSPKIDQPGLFRMKRGSIRNLVFEQWLNERSSCVKQLLIAL